MGKGDKDPVVDRFLSKLLSIINYRLVYRQKYLLEASLLGEGYSRASRNSIPSTSVSSLWGSKNTGISHSIDWRPDPTDHTANNVYDQSARWTLLMRSLFLLSALFIYQNSVNVLEKISLTWLISIFYNVMLKPEHIYDSKS